MSDNDRPDPMAPESAKAEPGPAEQQPGAGNGQAQPVTELPAPTAEEVAELKDRVLRTLAEMENLRRRTQRDVEEARKYAVTGFARDLLDAVDNLGRALASVPPEAREQSDFMRNLVLGVEMTERALLSALEKHQVRRVEPKKGERFDHNLHQAMFEVPTAAHAPGTVAEVVQAGYVIADRLLRPALVGVARAAAPQDGAAPAQDAAPGATIDTVA